MIVPQELRLTQVRAIRYRMPLRRAYGTARGMTTAGLNFLVQLTAEHRGAVVEGVGECQPRHKLTGDGGKDRVGAWGFLCAAADHLHGRTLRFADRESGIAAVRALTGELEGIAAEHADDSNRDRPYRGTMLGLEVAVLDVVSRSLGLQISELLGKQRDEVAISTSTISSNNKLEDVGPKAIKQSRFPMTRVKGIGDIAYDLQLLEVITNANKSVGREKPLWIDINEALDFDGGTRFVHEVASRMSSGALPTSMVIEGMLPKADVVRLPELQRLADDETQDRDLDLRIMPDEGLWDKADLDRLNELGGCRAINIKAPKAGGLLASLDLANAAVAADPDVHISMGGMIGTSDITAWALHNLARALPRLDYSTTVPPRNVQERIALPLASYVERGSNVIAPQTEPGLGTQLRVDKLEPYIEATHKVPAATLGRSTSSPAAGSPATKTLVFAGDTSLGDVHVHRKGGGLLRRLEKDPMSFFSGLKPLVADHDALILNLETVLADSPTSPYEGKKPYLGWDSPARTIDCLKQLGVDAVSLANNHTMDFGEDHLLDTKRALEQAGIAAFGAGVDRAEASKPWTLPLDFDGEVRRVHIFGAMQIQRKLRDEFIFYAGASRAGVNSLALARLVSTIQDRRTSDPSSLIIVFPHWGRNYAWTDERAREAAADLLGAGANLILGHGAHTVQQCTFSDHTAVVYSLGNFMFNWGGRFEKYGAPPFGLVARIGLGYERSTWNVDLRLYPILADNRQTDHRPRPANEEEFEAAVSSLRQMDLDGSFGEMARTRVDSGERCVAFTFQTGPAAHEPDVGVAGDADGGTYYLAASKDLGVLSRLNPDALDSHFLEREALAHGLCSVRFSPRTFLAGLTPGQVGEIAFHHTASTMTSRVARDLTRDAKYLNAMLRDAGLPYREQSTGLGYQAIVIDGQVASMLRRGRPDARDVADEAHPKLKQLAAQALTVIPGLRHAGVDLSLDDHTKPPSRQRVAIVGINHSPRLASHELAPGSGNSVARELLLAHLTPDQREWRADEPSAFAVSVVGVLPPDVYLHEIEKLAVDLGLTVDPAPGDRGSHERLFVTGDARTVAAVSALLFVHADPPEMVDITPIQFSRDVA